MDPKIKQAIQSAVAREPFARRLNMRLAALAEGSAEVVMDFDPAAMGNIYGRAHGGVIFALIDEAFEAACQTSGVVTVALNVSITYITSPQRVDQLRAVARPVHQTRRTASFAIEVTDSGGRLIATAQALGYRTGKELPFLE